MRTKLLALLVAVGLGAYFAGRAVTRGEWRCVPSSEGTCVACKNCEHCKWCRVPGNSCSVCVAKGKPKGRK